MEKILLAAPRGFCAGVAYAIEVVDLALEAFGAPLYVRHAIVHNEHVVRSFERRGAIFVEDLEDVPEGANVVFSAHGVSPAVREQAKARNLNVIDATCPLVSKVHREITRFARQGYHILYIGHRGHVEAIGSTGHAPNQITLIDNIQEAETVQPPADVPLAVATQTTLSVDEVNQILTVLRRRFPQLELPKKEDICYATTSRQTAVKALAKQSDLVLVVGSTTSSNSNRLREVAEAQGVPAYLLLEPHEVRPEWTQQARVIGVTSGASTPESSTEAIIGKLLEYAPNATVETLKVLEEDVEFIPPRTLIAQAQAARVGNG
ncbi:MAG: 4-hydroxy-3-methylbut-2-enyl diphosphate reductase [Fimbriimonadales bacterium]|nr:4-hydroxy-3-methylbut-2-enyl diphosphate reductase [Fimbriimonadales bacterium]